MNASITYRLSELADRLGGRLDGDGDLLISGVNDLASSLKGEISFVTSGKYRDALATSAASAVVVPPDLKADRPSIVVDRPEVAFSVLLGVFAPPVARPEAGVHVRAVAETDLPPSVAVGANSYIGPRTTIGENTVIHPNVFIGSDVAIGSDCVIWPGTAIRERVTIGDRVIIHLNVSIGGDGFGYDFIDGKHVKIPHIGTVIIGNDVEIGCGTTIDRGKCGATRIGSGTKVDNLVQIAHNIKIGRNVILVAHVGIGGSATIGDYAVIGGNASVKDHVNLGNGVKVAAMGGVTKDIGPGLAVNGIPAYDSRQYLRDTALVRKLPQFVETMTRLDKQVDELKQAIHDLK